MSAVVGSAFFVVMIIFGASVGKTVMLKASVGPVGPGEGVELAAGEPAPLASGAGDGVGVGVGVGDGLGLAEAFAFPEGDGAGVGRLKRSTQLKPPDSGHGMPFVTSATENVCVSDAVPFGAVLGAAVAEACGLV